MPKVTPAWSWLLTRWDLEPSVVVGIAALSVGYLYLCGYRLEAGGIGRPRGSRPLCSTRHFSLFFMSMAVVVVALLSPLDSVGDQYLFSAHMVQHLLLASLFPPLFLLSLPEAIVAPLFRVKGLSRALRWLVYPAVAFLVFNVDIAVWHLPAWYDLTLRNGGVHILEHLTFLAAGVIVWWPVLSPIRSQRMSLGMQEFYLFANLFPLMALGIFFSFWQHPLYGPYIAAPRLWGISALNDQQIGGLIMWMPGDAPYAIAMAAILMSWFDRGDPAEQRRVWARRVEESIG